jgi:hydroxymethylglutaryl-CoA lyase
MTRPNIILTGFMGTGKTTVGRILARRLGYRFVDTDELIEKRQGCDVARIFREHGEAAFRAMEAGIARELAGRHGLVIATGGGLLLDEHNAAVLGRSGRIFCLTARPEEILERVGRPDGEVRPLLAVDDPLTAIRSLLARREATYAAFEAIETTGRRPEAVAAELLAAMGTDQAGVILEDVALRDGLQIEARPFALAQKRRLFDLLRAAGLKRVQVGALVHPGRVPQMADTDELVRVLARVEGVDRSVLVLNARGLDRALGCGARRVEISASLSDDHSRRNAGRPADQALDEMMALIRRAREAGLGVRAGLQCVFGCLVEGPTATGRILAAARRAAEAGAQELNLADTTGMADPVRVRRVVETLARDCPHPPLALHLHDTRGLGLANLFAGFEAGVRIFDTGVGGLGGCPFVAGAAGNIPTEDAVHLFEALGVFSGIDLAGLCRAVAFLEQTLERPLPGRMCRVRRALEKGGGPETTDCGER